MAGLDASRSQFLSARGEARFDWSIRPGLPPDTDKPVLTLASFAIALLHARLQACLTGVDALEVMSRLVYPVEPVEPVP